VFVLLVSWSLCFGALRVQRRSYYFFCFVVSPFGGKRPSYVKSVFDYVISALIDLFLLLCEKIGSGWPGWSESQRRFLLLVDSFRSVLFWGLINIVRSLGLNQHIAWFNLLWLVCPESPKE